MADERVFIGTAGFGYKDWVGNFYPLYCKPDEYLRRYAERFDTVELDSTFYGVPKETSVERWAASTPDRFRFAAKFPRTVTHEGTSSERLVEAARFVGVMKRSGAKLGPLLLQFPPGFTPESKELLERLMGAVPGDVRLAVELRHIGWFEDWLYKMLERRGAALCLIDYPGVPRLEVRTTDWSYIRLIGDHRGIQDDYSYVRHAREEELEWWSQVVVHTVEDESDVYGYVNNHFSGHAPSTAKRFRQTALAQLKRLRGPV